MHRRSCLIRRTGSASRAHFEHTSVACAARSLNRLIEADNSYRQKSVGVVHVASFVERKIQVRLKVISTSLLLVD